MKNNDAMTKTKLLRTTYPQLYSQLMEELATHHIHPFDIQATCKQMNNNVEIQVRFGEGYVHERTKTFRENKINEKNVEFTNFCKEIGETCKETLIADYFKMVKP